jgi:hypothetical protein
MKHGKRIMWRKNMTGRNTKRCVGLIAVAFGVITMFIIEAKAQSTPDHQAELTTALERLRPGLSEDKLFTELETRNELRKAALLDYSVLRTYRVIDNKGKVHAEEVGRMEFHAPDQKTFILTSESGSGMVRRMALNALISSEIEAAAGKVHHDSSISAANYSLDLLGEQQVGPYHCFVAQVLPKRKDKYLFEGKMWIDADDYAVVRIEGHPAKRPSFWIERADFVRQYQKIAGFWLPEKDQTFVQVRLYGKKVLTIAHENYTLNAAQNKAAQALVREPSAEVLVDTN